MLHLGRLSFSRLVMVNVVFFQTPPPVLGHLVDFPQLDPGPSSRTLSPARPLSGAGLSVVSVLAGPLLQNFSKRVRPVTAGIGGHPINAEQNFGQPR